MTPLRSRIASTTRLGIPAAVRPVRLLADRVELVGDRFRHLRRTAVEELLVVIKAAGQLDAAIARERGRRLRRGRSLEARHCNAIGLAIGTVGHGLLIELGFEASRTQPTKSQSKVVRVMRPTLSKSHAVWSRAISLLRSHAQADRLAMAKPATWSIVNCVNSRRRDRNRYNSSAGPRDQSLRDRDRDGGSSARLLRERRAPCHRARAAPLRHRRLRRSHSATHSRRCAPRRTGLRSVAAVDWVRSAERAEAAASSHAASPRLRDWLRSARARRVA